MGLLLSAATKVGSLGISALDMDSPGYIGHTRDGGKTWQKAEEPYRIDAHTISTFSIKKMDGQWAKRV